MKGILFLDVDGTMTDGSIHISEQGELFKSFNVKDGYALTSLLPLINYTPVVLTGRKSIIVNMRCKELGIDECYQGVIDKKEIIFSIIKKLNANPSNTAYIGDDINDVKCMLEINRMGGITGCPSDAADKVKSICSFVSEKKGGKGAVRDFIEFLMLSKGYITDSSLSSGK